MDWDPTSGILTVSGVEGVSPGGGGANYPFVSLSIANVLFDLVGEQITSVTQLTQNLFTTLNNGRFDPAAQIAFAGNGLDIDWFITPGNNADQVSILTGGTATFRVTTSAPATGVPEPSTLLLLSSGLALTGLGKRRQRQNLV